MREMNQSRSMSDAVTICSRRIRHGTESARSSTMSRQSHGFYPPEKRHFSCFQMISNGAKSTFIFQNESRRTMSIIMGTPDMKTSDSCTHVHTISSRIVASRGGAHIWGATQIESLLPQKNGSRQIHITLMTLFPLHGFSSNFHPFTDL